MAFPEDDSEPRAPGPAVYVQRGEDDAPHLISDMREIEWTPELRIASSPTGRFVTLGDAIDNAPDVREGLLSLSPDPALERWRRFRPLALGAPLSWAWFVASEFKQVKELSADVKRVVESPEYKELELEPATSAAAKAKHAKYDRAIAMKWAYAGMESAVGLAALIVVIAGYRRFRAIPISLGFAAALWWLFHAGQPDKCFRAPMQWVLAILGLTGAIATFVLAPSETKIIRGLRQRLGIHRENTYALKQDLLATVAAGWAGVSLPFLLRGIGAIGIGDRTRAVFFVGFCFFAFLAFLAWRREESLVPPVLPRLALVAFLGFGITAACDVAARATLATYIEAKTCISPESAAALKKVQESSAKETTAARKETQTQALAFWIAVLAAPIAEELLYRGALQRVARRRLGGRGAMILSACVFGFAHALAFPTAFYQHFGLGLAFAAVFELAGGGAVGVVASAATHAMWNGWLATMPVFG